MTLLAGHGCRCLWRVECAFFARHGTKLPWRSIGQRNLAATATTSLGKQRKSGLTFDRLALHPQTLRGLQESFGFSEATEVQAKVLPRVLAADASGSDFVIHARAGTGKTLAYLIPAVEHLIKNPPPGVGVLILAPSRELVLQITKDAETLCSYHALQIVPLIGGIRRDKDEAAIRRRRPAILVGTVWKLLEHFEATRRFETLFDALSILVLDECDELLRQDAAASLQTFLSFLPPRFERQTMLLSATVPEEVRHFCGALCRPRCEWLDLVQGLPTQEAVEQFVASAPPLLLGTALRNVLDTEIQDKPMSHKVMVFFPTARLAAFATTLFQEQLNMRIHQIHARCTPSARMIAQEEFSAASCGILFTSAASERGMDYPDVTLVVQVMAPNSLQQYVHRVGRTARGGKEGRALLLLLQPEESFLSEIEELPVQRSPDEALILNDEGLFTQHALSSAKWASRSSLKVMAAAAFASVLQHLKTHYPKMENQEVVDLASELLMGFGVSEPPLVSLEFARELGLEKCENLALVEQRDDKARPVHPSKGP
eukprot:s1818_g20.t1